MYKYLWSYGRPVNKVETQQQNQFMGNRLNNKPNINLVTLYGQEHLLDNVISNNWTTSTHSQTHFGIYLKEVLVSGCIGGVLSWQHFANVTFFFRRKTRYMYARNGKHSSWIDNCPLQYMYCNAGHICCWKSSRQKDFISFTWLLLVTLIRPSLWKRSSSIRCLTIGLVQLVCTWTHLTLCGQALGQSTEWLHKAQISGLRKTTCMC